MGEHVSPQSFAAMRDRLAAGHTDLEEEVTCLLDRVAGHEKQVHALLPDETTAARRTRLLEEASALEARWPDPADRPPLFGAMVGVKDLFHTHGFPVRGGSQLPAEAFQEPGAPGLPPEEPGEAPVVHALRTAGALVLGKTVSTEFAYFAPGPTRNPQNTRHTPGGSSSGSAAAVAAGMCHLALGTQTIGSITRPASFCGVAGYKPSYGRVSTAGVIPFSPDADHVGPIAADVATIAAVAPVIVDNWRGMPHDHIPPVAGVSAAPAHADLRHTIGPVLVPDDAYLEQADDAGRAGLEAMIERLTGLGVDVQRIAVFGDIAEINDLHQAMIARDFAEVHAFWLPTWGERYHERSRELVARGEAVSDDLRHRARDGRLALRERLEHALRRHGARLWMAPATVGEAPKGIDSTGNPIMNLPWTYAGLPTVSVSVSALPHGSGPTGLPLGVQCAAPFGEDEALIGQMLTISEYL